MGIKTSSARLLCNLKQNTDINYSNTLMLGRQSLDMEDHRIQGMFRDYKDVLQNDDIQDDYCEKLFLSLGAEEVNSMDASEYEGATVIHDLNRAIPPEWEESYTCIVDGGTTEHVYNFPQAIWNVMKMLKVGGYYVGLVPSNNWNGHGFYQFSPMLYIQLFSECNHFELKKIYFCQSGKEKYLWEIVNTDQLTGIKVNRAAPMELYVVAKKTSSTPDEINLQQRMYAEEIWKGIEKDSKLKRAFGHFPFRLQELTYFYYYLRKNHLSKTKL